MFIQDKNPRAFTILELIVAMAVTVLMIVMINALFTATSDGVSVGIALSDVIGSGRAVSDQIERDANEMIGPETNPPGFLVIVCQKSPDNRPYTERRFTKARSVRMDQVLWVRTLAKSTNGFGAMPIAPASDSTFTPPTKTQMLNAADAVRVWYGHVQLTNPAGTGVTAFGTPGPNHSANTYALGRHAMFMVNDKDLNGVSSVPTFNHAKGAYANAAGPGGLVHQGVTDVAYVSYTGGPIEAGVSPGVVIGTAGTPAGEFSPNTLWHQGAQATAMYHSRALEYMFLEDKRMWANPFPYVNYADNSTWMTSRQVAQMHPLMMNNVSDFIVEFAADMIDDADVANLPDGFDGGPDVYAAGTASAGETVWYGLENNEATNSKGPPTWAPRTATDVESPVVSGGPPGGGVAYVFRHGRTPLDHPQGRAWPYMIRIRYRIQDTRGELLGDRSLEGTSDTSNVGKWFEQIIKVRRD